MYQLSLWSSVVSCGRIDGGAVDKILDFKEQGW